MKLLNNMLNQDLFVLINLIVFIYLLGYLLLNFVAGKIISRFNLFLRLAYTWMAGNSLLVVLLTGLFFSKKYEIITLNNFFYLYLLVGGLFLFFLFKKKIACGFCINEWLYLVIILLFYAPLVIDSITSFALGWDALAIWFFKSKAIFLPNNFFDYVKNNNWLFSSQAYPIGIPLIVSCYYRLIGLINDQTIQLYFFMFYLNLVFLVFGVLLKLFGNMINKLMILMITLGFLISSNFIIYSHNGYLDLPLGGVLASLFSLVYWFLSENRKYKLNIGYLIIIFSGLALVVKNEGLPFVGFVGIVIIVYILKDRLFNSWKKITQLLAVIFVFFYPFCQWQIYKNKYQIPSFLDGNYLVKSGFLGKSKIIFNYFFMEFLNTNKYNLILIVLILLFIFELSYLIFNRQFKMKNISLIFIFLSQIFAYIYVYIITPLPLVTQIESSLERLMLQIIPVFFLLVTFLLKEILALKKINPPGQT